MTSLKQVTICPHCASSSTVFIALDSYRCNLCGKEFMLGKEPENQVKKPKTYFAMALSFLGLLMGIIFSFLSS